MVLSLDFFTFDNIHCLLAVKGENSDHAIFLYPLPFPISDSNAIDFCFPLHYFYNCKCYNFISTSSSVRP